MKPRIILYSICVAAFFGALFGPFYFSSSAQELRRTHRHMRELSNAPVAREVALACTTLLDSISEFQTLHLKGSDSRISPAILSTKPSDVIVDSVTQTVTIYFGSDLSIYGYRFEPVSSSTAKMRLILYSEEKQEGRELLRL